jgi:hypothetical protein
MRSSLLPSHPALTGAVDRQEEPLLRVKADHRRFEEMSQYVFQRFRIDGNGESAHYFEYVLVLSDWDCGGSWRERNKV